MSKFRKRPMVIEARQFDGTIGTAYDLLDWMWYGDGRVKKGDPFPKGVDDPRALSGYGTTDSDDGPLWIRTMEGQMTVSPQDWVICGVKGEFYPCKPDIFAATYEPVETTEKRE
jgi:hypothetical protein